MNPDLYAAWLAAGNNLQPVGAWLGRNWAWLGAAVVAAGVAWWALRRELRAAGDQVATILADQPQQQPSTDAGLYLDCVAAYGDCDELDRLRDAIDQHRKEKP
jgi:cbb3-type cytochrome oxidase subunit 3